MPKTRIISTVLAAAAASGITLALAAAPAMATPTTAPSTTPTTRTPPPPCASAPPLTKPCSATVANSSGTYTVTLPGVGTLTFTIDPTTNQVVLPANAVSNLGANFTATTPKVDGDGVSVTFINAATPQQVYHLDVDVKPTTVAGSTATTPPTVTAIVKGRGHGDGHGGHDGGHDGDHHGSGGGTWTAPSTGSPTASGSGRR